MKSFSIEIPSKLRWICASTARCLVAPYVKSFYSFKSDALSIDLFTVYRLLSSAYPDTIFYLVDDPVDERMEIL